MFRLDEFQLVTRLGLRRLKRDCRKQGHEEHVALIDKALDDPDMLAAVAVHVSSQTTPRSDEIYLAPDGNFLITILDWFIENGPELLELLAKLAVIFA